MTLGLESADQNIYQWIKDETARREPREAVVTRSDGKGVWVRFTPVDASAPETQLPSTDANLSPGTKGWVFTLGGGKGLFVATGVTLADWDTAAVTDIVAQAVEDDPTIANLESTVGTHSTAIARVAPSTAAPAVGHSIAQGIMGPVWKSGPVNADWYSNIQQSFDAAGVGGTVEFSKGVSYSATTPIGVQNDQTIIGNDVMMTVTGDVAFKSKNTDTQVQRFRMDGLRVFGNNNLGTVFDFTGMTDAHVSNFQWINWVDFGAYMGGDKPTGGWSNTLSHGRIWASPVSSNPLSACVYIGDVGPTGIPNGNNNTIFDVRMQSNANHALVINYGDGNQIIACDMGYAASGSAPPAVLLRGGVGTRGNSFLANRYEKAAGNLVIEDAYDNLFLGEYYGTPLSGYSGYNVRILAGNGNTIQPTQAGVGAASDWVQINADGNIVIYRGRYYTRNANYPVFATRRPGESVDRFSINEAGRMQWGAGGAPDVQLDRVNANTLRLGYGDTFMIEGGGWNTGGLQLGPGRMWRDSNGNIRWKASGSPTGDTDGIALDSSGGGGSVVSVNGKTGVVVLDADDIDLSDYMLATNVTNALPANVGTNGQVLKVASGGITWATDTNTTYSEISEAEITAGTASTLRTITGRRIQSAINKARDGLMAVAEFLIDTSGPATGDKVRPVATGNRAVAVGSGAIADGDYANAIGTEAKAVGANSTAIGYQASSFSNSSAIGYQAETTANNTNAFGYGAKVDAVQSNAMGRFSTVGPDEPFVTEFGGQTLRVLRRGPNRDVLAFDSVLQLTDLTGAIHTLGMHATDGLTYDGNSVSMVGHTHPVSEIDASGTPNSSTFLRGDGVWITPPGGGGSGGAVDSVNGQAGTVVLDADDIDATANRLWMAAAERTKLSGIEAGAQVNVTPTWGSVTGKPTTFPPAAHSHSWAQVTGKPTTFPPAPHTHNLGDLSGKVSSVQIDSIAAAQVTSGRFDIDRMPTAVATDDEVSAAIAGVLAAIPRTLSNRSNASVSVSSAGNYGIAAAAVTFTGLIPSTPYTVTCDISLMAGTAGRIGATARIEGATVVRTPSPNHQDLRGTNNQVFHETATVTVNAKPNGEIYIYPEAVWAAGSFSVWWAGLTVTVQKA